MRLSKTVFWAGCLLLVLAVSPLPGHAATTSATTVVSAKKAVKKVIVPVKHTAAAVTKKTVVKKAVVVSHHGKHVVAAPVKAPVAVSKTLVTKTTVVKKAAVVEAKPVVKEERHRHSRHGGDVGAVAATAAVVADSAPEAPVVNDTGGPVAPLMVGGNPDVRELAVLQNGRQTRLVLALTNSVNYRWFTLPQPARLVIDFTPEVHFTAEPSKVDLPQGSQVEALRAGRFRPGTVRMVVDLKTPAKLNVRMQAAAGNNGPRLLVDVTPPKGSEQATNVPPPTDVVTAAAVAEQPAVPEEAGATAAAPVQIEPAKKNGKTVPAAEQAAIADAPTAEPTLPVRPIASKKGSMAPIIVVLDPGHGGVDPGTNGKSYGTLEKNLTLAMARRVRQELLDGWDNGDGKPPLKIIMTRDSDVYIPLPERVKIAQRANADLFVSLHADSAPDRSVTGATVYMVSDKGSDREARRLAEQENSGDALAGIPLENESKEVQNILISLVQRDTMNNSTYLGQNILQNVGATTAVRKRQLMYAGFRVLKAADVPSVLVEMGYLSNPREEQELVSPDHQHDLAHAIAVGVIGYIKQYVHH